jgi:hypothetical protein
MEIDPIFEFADEATAHFPTRKQRLYALAYVRALQTSQETELRKMVPPNLYRPVRHFLAESEWDHREVIWRAAARLLRQVELDWIGCRVSSVAGKWSFAWLAGYVGDHVIHLDLVMIGPARLTRSAADYIPAQLDILRTVPDQVLKQAPVGIGGALADLPQVRDELDQRGISYSAKVRLVGPAGRGLRRLAEGLRSDKLTGPGPNGVQWGTRDAGVPRSDAGPREVMVAYWHGDELASVVLTNIRERDRLEETFGPRRADWAARPRGGRVGWRRTALRGRMAWEHHLALVCVVHGYGVESAASNDVGP